MPLNQ
jgi:hypothetical protein